MCRTDEGFLKDKIASRHNVVWVGRGFDRAQDLNGFRGEDGREPLFADLSYAVMMREGPTRSQNLVAGNRLQFLKFADGLHEIPSSIVESKVEIHSRSGIVNLRNSGRNEVVGKLSSCKLNERMLTIYHRYGMKFSYQCILS